VGGCGRWGERWGRGEKKKREEKKGEAKRKRKKGGIKKVEKCERYQKKNVK